MAEVRSGMAGVQRSEATGWAAWVLFGGVILFFVGALHVVFGCAALLRPEVLAGSRSDELLPVGLDALGVVHLVLGGVAAVVGVGTIRGLRWARWGAVGFAAMAILVNFVFLRVHPFWSATVITLGVVVIYAVLVHGHEVAEAYAPQRAESPSEAANPATTKGPVSRPSTS